jgi:hypothetical protein
VKKPAATGRSRKHASAGKHGGTSKHHPTHHRKQAKSQAPAKAHTVAKHPTHSKPRALAPGEAVACCSAEAIAASLRLTGRAVSGADVLAIHSLAGGTEDAGVAVLAALEMAAEHGLAGVRPVSFETVPPCAPDVRWPGCPALCLRGLTAYPGGGAGGLILGVELPGPHAVTIAPDGCWVSWGEHWDPATWPGAVIEEAWVVTWP